jgi:hypothetical protein
MKKITDEIITKAIGMGLTGVIAILIPSFYISPIPQLIALLIGAYLIYNDTKKAIVIALLALIASSLVGLMFSEFHVGILPTTANMIVGFTGGFIGGLLGSII